MRCSRFYTTPAGGSAFDTVEIPLDRSFEDGHGNRIRTTRTFASDGVRLLFVPFPAEFDPGAAPLAQD